ncbi:MAG TPA: prolyl oligopeptidase family serine peptidase [Candidatus Limnocylindrales bacterium]|nr:prolyl oligopeptidase family serine peptidase [Candidatus Limnocylindrales bacterium]
MAFAASDDSARPAVQGAWESRFRAIAIVTSRIAANDPSRGLVSSNRSGVVQLYAWAPATGALTQITDEATGRIFAELSPDGLWACYLRDQGGNETGHFVSLPTDGGPEVDLTPGLAPYNGELITFSRHGGSVGFVTASDDTYVVRVGRFTDGRVTDLRAVLSTRSVLAALTVSADGRFVVVSSSHRSNGLEFSLVTVDAATGEPGPELWDGPGSSLVVFACSPVAGDERILATTNVSGPEHALVWNRATGDRTDLPSGMPDGDLIPLDWSSDGRLVLLCRIYRAVQSLFVWDVDAQVLRPLDHPAGAFLGYLRLNASYFAPGSREIVARWEDFANPRRLLALDASTGRVTRTILNAGPVPNGRAFSSIDIATSGGVMVQAWLARPVGTPPFPVILSTHGGPTAVTSANFDAPAQAFLDAGFAVLALNYRGSTTFGREFEQSIWGRLGELELQDMAAARSWLVQNGVGRPDQILLTGWSYGGYLTLLGLGRQPDLWAGGMAGIAIADWLMNYEDSSDLLRGYQRMLFNGAPEDPTVAEAFRVGSPLTYVDDIRAPVLIIQGRNDTRTPARPVERYVERLQARGHPVEIDWFDAGHTGGAANDELAIEQTQRIIAFARSIVGARPTTGPDRPSQPEAMP